jgi:hypothetical protein
MIYLPGFFYQVLQQHSDSTDWHIKGSPFWRFLLGIRNTDKIYLRGAFLQILALIYLIVGVGTILIYKTPIDTIKHLTWYMLGGGVVGGTIVGSLIEFFLSKR